MSPSCIWAGEGRAMSREDAAGAPAASGLLARLSVQNWVHLILAGFVLVVCGCLVVGGIVMSRISDRTTDLVDRIQPARASSYQLQNSLLDQETGVRGFALTRDDTFLEPYDAGRRAERIMLARVRVLVGDEQPFAGDLDRIEEASQEWRSAARPACAGGDRVHAPRRLVDLEPAAAQQVPVRQHAAALVHGPAGPSGHRARCGQGRA